MPETQLTSAKPEARLKELGVTLPTPAKPLASYIPWVRTGNLVYVSGQLPMRDGKVAFTGKVGKDLNVAKAQEAAVLCCHNSLAIVRDAIGSLDNVKRVVRAVGHVNCAAGFTDVHVVTNGASDFLALVFGENGRHTRLSLGAAELPLNAAFEFDLIVEV
ncbi:MAG TPA: RidA family protein [Candidatus Thermoplasmatota archaeon]|nr:RidA family protein [Candidatus Thermoplasmatota archaeon]